MKNRITVLVCLVEYSQCCNISRVVEIYKIVSLKEDQYNYYWPRFEPITGLEKEGKAELYLSKMDGSHFV
jgi:hypothetical protein